MKVIIDTSSWLSLVKYYLPFDQNQIIDQFLTDKIRNQEILVIDKVHSECKYVSKGIVLESFDIIGDKNNHCKTNELFASRKFINRVDNQFCYQVQKNKLNDVEFENAKTSYLNSADISILLKVQDLVRNGEQNVFIVTEESNSNNDSKLFKKIPIISSYLDLECITLPALIKKFENEINLLIHKPV